MDKDTGSIGGLKNPPPVTPKLYYASIIVDIGGLLLCSLAGWQHMVVMMGYVAFSKGYSWHGIRFKKYAYAGWLLVAFFQGGYTFMLANMAAEDNVSISWFTEKNVVCMVIATILIGAYYPLTQIYQHEEDGQRGDYTISYRLGVMGTFMFSGLLFLIGTGLVYYYFKSYYNIAHFFVFLSCLAPVVCYFIYWLLKAAGNRSYADYTHAMLMTKISSVCMVICFILLALINQHLTL